MKGLQLALLACVPAPGLAVRIVCYFASWSVYGNEVFRVEDIDASHCTHFVYSFLGLDTSGNLKSIDPWNDIGDEWHEGGLKKFPRLKNSNPSAKILLGVGGWNEGSYRFQQVVRSPEKRKVFLESSLAFIKNYRFDGLEIDWFYQDGVGGTEEDRNGFSELVKEMRAKYEANGYVLGIATSANTLIFDNSYNITALSQYADFINVISYDLRGSWDGKTGHVAPLYPMKGVTDDERNVEAVVKRYIKKGASPSKMNVGVVGYGRTFTLKDPAQHGMDAPTVGPGKVDPLHYRDFCVQDMKGLWVKYRQKDQAVPFAVAGNQWVGYEDVESLVEKAKFIKSNKLGGITFWSIDMDDFKGKCSSGKYPLLRAIKTELMKP